MSNAQRRWTPKEDDLIRKGVKQQSAGGEVKTINWNEIAKSIPGRTNKDCRKRYYNEVTGGLRKGPWAEEEDDKLRYYVSQHGTSWALIAQKLGCRSADQCSKRWQHCLDPNLDRRRWQEDENDALLAAVATHGTSWKDIQTLHFPTRSANNVKNQYMIITRKLDEIPLDWPPCCPNIGGREPSISSDEASQNSGTFQDHTPSSTTKAELNREYPNSSSVNIPTNELSAADKISFNSLMDHFPNGTTDFSYLGYDDSAIHGSETRRPSNRMQQSELELWSTPDLTRGSSPVFDMDLDRIGSVSLGMQPQFPSTGTSYPSIFDTGCSQQYPVQSGSAGSVSDYQTIANNTDDHVPTPNRVTITLDNVEAQTVMNVMNVLVGSKGKVMLETT